MGIDASFKAKDLIDAGCKLHFIDEWENDDDVQWYDGTCEITFPDGLVWYVRCNEDHTELNSDFNHWGRNRPALEPRFKELNIPYVEW